jgi:hypothetical protein
MVIYLQLVHHKVIMEVFTYILLVLLVLEEEAEQVVLDQMEDLHHLEEQLHL